ncbi:PHD finger protein 6 [Xenopus laevis]|uniref:PHD finger protein 6 n=2 Tax=Xenopus laevis TaxID=8355 RepID=A0A1L8HAD2_XENLA|nr:PHD finger protein 6 [Xenopus laevis]XP_041440414.1 PHD finger protein 6 [Xenopus laevis]OCT93042.1 hypothetical protein XELAEV_18016108mg [Xenopus laevis]
MPNSTPVRGVCAFCHHQEQNEETGRLLKTSDYRVTAHFNCMIFSPNVITTNSPRFGGFDIRSVIKEVKRGKRMRCCFCKKTGATIGCDVQWCRKTYHYMCAKKDQGLIIENEEEEQYLIYCSSHKNVAQDTATTSSGEELNNYPVAGDSGRDSPETPPAKHQICQELLTAVLADQQNTDMESHEYEQEVVHCLSAISASQQRTEAHLRCIGDALWQLVAIGRSSIQTDVSQRDAVTQTELVGDSQYLTLPQKNRNGDPGPSTSQPQTRQLRRRTAGSSKNGKKDLM